MSAVTAVGVSAVTAVGSAMAQTPAQAPVGGMTLPVHSPAVAASGENSRLRQMEVIYQQQLRARHIPILGSYLTTLQSRLAAATDPAPYTAEIERVQGLIVGGGVVDLSAAARALQEPSAVPMPNPMPPPGRSRRMVVSLTPSLALSISPLPAGSASPVAAAVGEIEWRINALPAGVYDVVLQYSLPVLKNPMSGDLEFAGQKIPIELDGSKTTPKSAYRLLRLGQLTLPEEVRGEVLRLRAGAKDSKELLVREIVLTRAASTP